MILVVDDHVDSAIALKRLLMMEGYEAATAFSGSEALQLLEHLKPSLVICDFHMPDIDGLTLFRSMRADPALRKIPMIIFSAYDGDARETGLGEGIAAWVAKGSLDLDALFAAIMRLVGPAAAPSRVEPGPDDRETKRETEREREAC